MYLPPSEVHVLPAAQSPCPFLLIRPTYHDDISIIDHGEILWNVHMIQVPLDDVMTESRRVKVALGQSQECMLLSISCEYQPFLIHLSGGYRKEYICQWLDIT